VCPAITIVTVISHNQVVVTIKTHDVLQLLNDRAVFHGDREQYYQCRLKQNQNHRNPNGMIFTNLRQEMKALEHLREHLAFNGVLYDF